MPGFKPQLGEVVWWVSDRETGQTDCGMVLAVDDARSIVFNTVPRCLLLGELYPTEGEARVEYERRRNAGT